MNFEINVIPEWTTFISQLLSTAVLFFVVRHFLFKPVSQMINARKEKVESDFLEAKTKSDEAKLLRKEYENKIEKAKNEAREIVALAKQREDKIKQEVLEEAKVEAENLFLKAKSNIEREKEKTLSSLKNEIVELAMMAAVTAIDKDLNEDTHQEMISNFIHEVGEVEWPE